MKQIKIFKSDSNIKLMQEVNDFIANNKVNINDIQYHPISGSFFYPLQYSVMIVIEEDGTSN